MMMIATSPPSLFWQAIVLREYHEAEVCTPLSTTPWATAPSQQPCHHPVAAPCSFASHCKKARTNVMMTVAELGSSVPHSKGTK